jgi:hypothetical protein
MVEPRERFTSTDNTNFNHDKPWADFLQQLQDRAHFPSILRREMRQLYFLAVNFSR